MGFLMGFFIVFQIAWDKAYPPITVWLGLVLAGGAAMLVGMGFAMFNIMKLGPILFALCSGALLGILLSATPIYIYLPHSWITFIIIGICAVGAAALVYKLNRMGFIICSSFSGSMILAIGADNVFFQTNLSRLFLQYITDPMAKIYYDITNWYTWVIMAAVVVFTLLGVTLQHFVTAASNFQYVWKVSSKSKDEVTLKTYAESKKSDSDSS